MISTSSNRFGHYMVGNKMFLQKHAALLESHDVSKRMQYIYNDDVFNKYDWTSEPEPSVSLREFYRRRAQQIRDQYDYVVLAYSGGPDSTNILDSFLNNNIKIDEIVNFNSYAKTQQVDYTIHNADYVYNVKPKIEELQKSAFGSAIKITILDEIDLVDKIWKECADRDTSHILFGAQWFPSIPLIRGGWIKHVKHIWNKIVNGDKVCVIIGADKPIMVVDKSTNKYFSVFCDILSCDIAAMVHYDPDMGGKNVFEFFYNTPDQPDLTIKQLHTLKNYIQTLKSSDHFELSSVYDQINSRPPLRCESKHFSGSLKYDLYHKTIYPAWKPNFITPKETMLGTRPRDNWWFSKLDSSATKVWEHGIKEAYSNFKHDIKVVGSESSGMQLSYTKKYWLEK